MSIPTEQFDPQHLTALQREEMLAYYSSIARTMTVKIEQLMDGTHTIMCQKTIDNLIAIRNIYRERIEALVKLIDQTKRGKQ